MRARPECVHLTCLRGDRPVEILSNVIRSVEGRVTANSHAGQRRIDMSIAYGLLRSNAYVIPAASRKRKRERDATMDAVVDHPLKKSLKHN
jgi:hypothetical protein